MGRQPAKEISGEGAWKPRAFFWLLVACLLLLGVMELLNIMRRPSLIRARGPAGASGVVIYQKGRSNSREAWLLAEPGGEAGRPVCFQRIDCTEKDLTTGEIRWSFDGLALYATRRKAASIEAADRPLWVYDFKAQQLYSLTDAPLAHHLPMHAAGEAALVDLINNHGGKGPALTSWYELGKRGEYLFAWQITRWEQVLPAEH